MELKPTCTKCGSENVKKIGKDIPEHYSEKLIEWCKKYDKEKGLYDKLECNECGRMFYYRGGKHMSLTIG